MCFGYYEMKERGGGEYDILAWRDPKDGGNNPTTGDPMWPIAQVKDYTTAEGLVKRLNSTINVQAVEEYNRNGDPVYHKPYDNGFWPRPTVKLTELDPCTGEAREVEAA